MIETIYFCLSQVPYVATLVFALPRVSVGSRTYWVSNFHRLFGVLTLTYPLFLALYQSFYLSEPHVIFHLFGIFVISFNCIFGALLIRKRLNKFDIPTIRAFCVGVILGLSFVGLSLNYKFGHLKWYQPFGYFFSIYSIIAIIYSCNDSIQHLYRMITGPKQFRSINLGHFKPPKSPSDPEMKEMILDSFNNASADDDDDKYNKNKKKLTSVYQKATLYDAFILSTFKQLKNYNKIMLNCSLTPSNIPVVFTVTVTAIFALTNLLNVYYLKCGYIGMIYKRELHPLTMEMSIYGWLLAAVANNVGTFMGTLVVKYNVRLFWGAFFNAIGVLIPVFNIATFVYRFHEQENLLDHIFLTDCHA